MVGTFAHDTITRIRPGIKVLRDSEVPDWNNATTAEITDCSWQPGATSLSMDGRVLGISEGITCYCPAGADVQEGDRIMYDGKIYVINGVPKVWTSPTGSRSNVQLNLERWQG